MKFKNTQIIRLVWQELKANFLQATNNTVAGLLIVFLEFAFVWATKQTIDVATHVSTRFTLRQASIIMIATLAAQLLLSAYRGWVNAMLSIKATNKMQLDMFRHTLLTPWIELKAFHSGDIINRIEKDVNTIVHLVTDTLPAFITVCAQFIGAFLFLYIMDSTLALFVVVVIPLFVLLGKMYIKKMRKLSRKIRETDSRLQAQYQEGITNRVVIKTIKGATDVIVSRVLKTQRKIITLVHYRARYSVASGLVMNIGFSAAYLFTFLWGTHRLAEGLITYGALIAFVQLVGQIQRPARSLVKFIPEVIGALTAGERILEIKTIPEEGQGPNDPPLTPPRGRMAGHSVLPLGGDGGGGLEEGPCVGYGLRITDLTFGYKKDRDIISHLNFDFTPGSRTAIMGPTGQGKTTLIRLMLSLLTPHQGTIHLYRDDEVLPCDIASRHHFAYVPQGNTLFSGSIRANLKIAAPQATDQELNHALQLAKADFVFALPEGLTSPCGEHGISLSEGQAQRLCIARALLTHAPILLLDEATSALDPQTEAEVLHNICSTLTDTTIICISHRPKVLDYCDKVLNMG